MSNLQAPRGGAKEQSGLRHPTNGKTIYHRPLNRAKAAELSGASFAYLFSEMVSYASKKIESIQDLEKRLVLRSIVVYPPLFSVWVDRYRRGVMSKGQSIDRSIHLAYSSLVSDTKRLLSRLNVQGHPIGLKLLDLLLYREPARSQTRALNIITLLHFIKINVWQHLFGQAADGLEKSSDPSKPDEYMIIDNEPLVNRYISVPRDMSQLNCAAYVAGIIEGVCDGSAFPARVTAHSVGKQEEGEMWPGRTVFLVKFAPEVMERETFLGKG
ncbi:putative SPP30 protein [Xylaria castorea]|nr:putative SPP30 protein [Xylaria castorea]